MCPTSKIDSEGRLKIPDQLINDLNISPGQKFQITRKNGNLLLTKKRNPEALKELKGCVEESKISPMSSKEIWR